jgi:hypothetical protein
MLMVVGYLLLVCIALVWTLDHYPGYVPRWYFGGLTVAALTGALLLNTEPPAHIPAVIHATSIAIAMLTVWACRPAGIRGYGWHFYVVWFSLAVLCVGVTALLLRTP